MYSRTAMESFLHDDLGSLPPYLTSDMDLATARKVSLSKSLLKKYLDGSSAGADQRALQKFLDCNKRCSEYRLSFDTSWDAEFVGRLSEELNITGNGPTLDLDLSKLKDDLGLGPGANVGSQSYNFYTKLYDSKLTLTHKHLAQLYRAAIFDHPTRRNAEMLRFLVHGDRIVEGSRLSFVPKTYEISRTICTEPTVNMLFQKALGEYISRWLMRVYGIDFTRQQDVNRRMALEGSMNGKFATIDLESASDSISMSLCDYVLPRSLTSWLNMSRSPVTILPDGGRVPLDMISSMGNAFTFPLQTLIFSAAVSTVYRMMDIKPCGLPGPRRNFSVFGDDIIVLKETYETVTRYLGFLGFRVNKEKSFNSGHFRESCGEDYYRGHNIRGVYLTSLRTPSDIYSALNRLSRWSAKTGIVLPQLFSKLKSKLRKKIFLIPFQFGDDQGLKVPFSYVQASKLAIGKKHSFYALQARPYTVKLQQPSTSRDSVTLGLEYSNKLITRQGRQSSKRSSRVLYNADGLLNSFVGGFIREGKILLRSDAATYQTRRYSCPNWDFVPMESHGFRAHFDCWEAVMTTYL